MTLAFTPDGITIESLVEVTAELSEAYRSIYGQNINLDQDTPDGQRVGVEAKARADVQAFILDLYNSIDPDLARGVSLDRIIKIAGITRRPATRSSWDIDVTTNRPVTLNVGYTIDDDLGQSWQVVTAVDLPTGTTAVTFLAVDFGAVSNTAGAALTQNTIVLGVTALNAPGDPVVGANEETDVELRQRRNLSLQNPSYSTTGGLFARLANTPGVLDVQVYENDQDTEDVVRDIGPHTIWCVVEGGELADIAETIAKNKTGGTALKGTIEVVYNEERIRPNGSSFVVPHIMRFDRPVTTLLYVTVNATRKVASEPVDTVLIAQRLAARNYSIGEEAVASELYDVAYGDVEPNFFLTDLQISDDNVTFTDEQLTSALDGKFVIEVANVTVTEITPP